MVLLKGLGFIFLLCIIAWVFYFVVYKFLLYCKIDDSTASPAAGVATGVSALLFYIGHWLGLIIGLLAVLLIVFMDEYWKKCK